MRPSLRFLPFLIWALSFPLSGSAQPAGCSSLGLSLEPIAPCTYRLYYNNTAPGCFSQLQLLLDAGAFGNWTPNAAGGWSGVAPGETELLLTPGSGQIPGGPGYATDVYISNADTATLVVLYAYDCPLGKSCFASFTVSGCADPQNASIIGVKYKTCTAQPFTNQTPLSGWTIQLFDAFGNTVGTETTAADGAYAFTDLPAGQYLVKEMQQPDWTASLPAAGEIAVELDPSEQRIINFGNCPPPQPPASCACPANTLLSGNLVQNGNFSGIGGFNTGYTPGVSPPLLPGQYWIGANPPSINAGFSPCADHTGGGGNMLVVNGALNQSTAVWCQTVAVMPNSTYVFEAWVASLTNASPANLMLFINNVSLGIGFFADNTPCTWQRYCEDWFTGTNTSVTLCLYNLNPTASGNDFAIDDISVRKCEFPSGNLSGVVFRECDGAPFGGQPVLSGWTVQLFDAQDNLIGEQLTDGSGAYAFADLPPGNYIVRAAIVPGWTASVPASGQYAFDLSPGAQEVRNFGVCLPAALPCSCPTGYSPGANLVTNPAFSGSGGFGTQYTANNVPPLAPGQYWIGTNPSAINPAYSPCGDHTGGSGNMMVLSGIAGSNAAMWTQTIPVTPNTTYLFSGWITRLTAGTSWSVELKANGATIGYHTASGSPCTWTRFCVGWNSGSNTSVTLSLNTSGVFASGMAVALDDIGFQRCHPSIAQVIGVVHRNCDGAPYTDQPVLSDWPVLLLDTMGNVLDSQLTDGSGAYAFADLPPGHYWVKAALLPGWTSKLPASGQYTVNLAPGAQEVRNFGLCPPACITATVYRECGGAPFADQPVLPHWMVFLYNPDGVQIACVLTDSSGAVSFCDLPPGNYVVRADSAGGWHPNVPPSGEYAAALEPGGALDLDFGLCPTCSCDSIEILPYQVQSLSDTGFYQLSVSNQSPLCFSFIQVELGAVGEFIGWDSVRPGWSVELLNAKLLRIHWIEPQLPAGSFLPVLLKTTGTGEQMLTISTYWNGSMGDVACSRVFQNPVPTPLDACCINPGPNNLIPNGSFSSGNTAFFSDYALDCNNTLVGQYCITTNPNNANNNFSACPDYTTGSGLMLVANGSLQSSKRVWYRSIPVTAYTDYKFIFHYTPVNNSNKPTFGVSINNYNVSSNGFIGNVCSWIGMCVATWNSGNNTSANLAIRDLTTNLTGNDFALDDIWFFPCPLPCQATFTAAALDNCGKYQFTNTSVNLPANVQYCWDFDNNPATCESTAASPMWQFPTCGTYTVRLTLSGNGCSSTITQSITVVDNTPPTAVCQPSYSIDIGNNCTTSVTTAMVDAGSFDNCPQGLTLTVGPVVLVACQDNPITLTVEDWCGNTSSCTTTIYAAESQPPTALCLPPYSIDMGNNCATSVTTAMVDAGSFDNCPQGLTLTVGPVLLFACQDNPVTLTVEDRCGNTSSCTTNIYAAESQPPALLCPANLTLQCGPYTPSATGFAVAADVCSDPLVTYSDVVTGTLPCNATISRTWQAEDDCLNTVTCVQTITVNDNIPPLITNCPQSQTVGMDPGQCFYTFTPPALTATDNCDPDPALSCTYEEPSGTIWPLTGAVQLPKGITTIRCKATDDCGNMSEPCVYTLNVTDNQPPTLTCPQNVTVQSAYNAAGQCEAVVNGLAPTFSDNCPVMSLDYLISPSGATGQNDASGSLFNGISTVTYTAMDCGGFTKTCSFMVTVVCPPCTPVAGAACADTTAVLVECIPGVVGQYDFSFQVVNQSGFTADRIELTAVTPSGAFAQTVFNASVANNATSGPLVTTLNGLPGSTVCFKIALYRTAPNGVALECCETALICLTLPECPTTCNCAGADNLSFTYNGFTPNVSWPGPVAATCGDPDPVMLPCIPFGETPFAFHGVVHCDAADCLLPVFTYAVTDPAGTPVLPGGQLPLAVVGQDGYFDIYNLSANVLTPGVTYTMTITWFCGGKICQCQVKFQVEECDCHCISPVTNVAISSGTLTLSAPCGSTLFQGIPCPPAGNFVKVTGQFQCVGSECLPGKIVRYTLTGPNGPVATGAVLATPFFSINLLPQQMYAIGQYTITMTGECNGHPCTPCTFSFFHQCPEPCPCPDATFNNRVDQGFTVVSSGTACKACFVPKNLGPCETVEWFVNGSGPIGAPTAGNAPFCYTFSSTAIYGITMQVTRKKTDGSVCATRAKTLYIKILCDSQNSPCSETAVSNPDFGVDPVAGGLNSDGQAPGWAGAFGNPEVTADTGAVDGWGIQLAGNRVVADVLSRENAFCWVKDTGLISLRHRSNGYGLNQNQQPGSQRLTVRLYRGDLPNPLTDSCGGGNCFELVSLLLYLPDSSSDWVTLQIPYDLGGWAASDSCGDSLPDPPGVLVKPVVFVSNPFGPESGSLEETQSVLFIDNFCIDGRLVGTDERLPKSKVRIFPNPNTGTFTVELPEPAAPGLRLRITGLTGQVLREQAIEPGFMQQRVSVEGLPDGLYFLQVVSNGKISATEKFVKQGY